MDIQYKHAMNGVNTLKESHTLAVDVPKRDVLLGLVKFYLDCNYPEVVIDVGVSILHPKDRYVKKIGRSVAKSTMCPYAFKVKNINANSDLIFITLENKDGISLLFRVNLKSSRVWFLGN